MDNSIKTPESLAGDGLPMRGLPCGCRIDCVGNALYATHYQIRQCPLHVAAPDLRDALKEIQSAQVARDGVGEARAWARANHLLERLG